MDRKYNISDARLLQHTGVVLEALATDLPDFTAFDEDLNAALVAALNDDYQAALIEGGDDVARGKVGEKTQKLLDETKRADDMMKAMRYWLRKTFAQDPAALRRFGLAKYWKVRNRQAELVTYLNMLVSTVAEFRTELEEAKVPVALLDSVKTISDALTKADVVQENSKGGRQSATQARVLRLNALYTTDQSLNNAAEIIYSDNPAKRDIYRLPANNQSNTDEEEGEAE
ncbi:MAG: hypothetical protein RH948_19410 [Cyclobacteriaceae bacterium]